MKWMFEVKKKAAVETAEFDIEKLERCINSLGEKFIKWPYNFFTESDAHSFLYYYIFRSADSSLKKLYPSLDEKFKTVLVHREYPTIFKYSKKDMAGPSQGGRGHYDLAILNPEFVASHSIEAVIAKDFSMAATTEGDHLLAAIEFKFIHRPLDKNMRNEIEKDAHKLNWSITLKPPQSRNAYLLVFNRYRHESALIDDLQKWSGDYPKVKMLYVESVIAKKKYKKVVFSKGWKYQAPFLKNYL